MDHHWLDWLEAAVPAVQLAFLTPGERAAWRESHDGVRRGAAELARLRRAPAGRAVGDRARCRPRGRSASASSSPSRGEIAAGDRMVLRTLRARARERQRLWLGLPVLAAGALGGLAAGRAAVSSWIRTADEEDRA